MKKSRNLTMQGVLPLLALLFIVCSCTKEKDVLEIGRDGIFLNREEITETILLCGDECSTRLESRYTSYIEDSVLFEVYDYPESGIFIEKQLYVNEKDTIILPEGGFGAKFLMRNSSVGSKFSGILKIFSTEIDPNEQVSFDRIMTLIPQDIELREREIFNSISFQLDDLYTTFFFEDISKNEKFLIGIAIRRYSISF